MKNHTIMMMKMSKERVLYKQTDLAKARMSFSKRTGIPTTKATLERKIGKFVMKTIDDLIK